MARTAARLQQHQGGVGKAVRLAANRWVDQLHRRTCSFDVIHLIVHDRLSPCAPRSERMETSPAHVDRAMYAVGRRRLSALLDKVITPMLDKRVESSRRWSDGRHLRMPQRPGWNHSRCGVDYSPHHWPQSLSCDGASVGLQLAFGKPTDMGFGSGLTAFGARSAESRHSAPTAHQTLARDHRGWHRDEAAPRIAKRKLPPRPCQLAR